MTNSGIPAEKACPAPKSKVPATTIMDAPPAASTLLEGLYANVVKATQAAQATGDHAAHGSLHGIETLFWELKHKVGEAEKVLEGEGLALIQNIKRIF